MIYSYLTPFVPLSFKGEGEFLLEGTSPLRPPIDEQPYCQLCTSFKGEGRDIKKRGFAPLRQPLSLVSKDYALLRKTCLRLGFLIQEKGIIIYP